MSALSFDPWALLKTKITDGHTANPAKAANCAASEPARLARLAALAETSCLPREIIAPDWTPADPRTCTPDRKRLDELDAVVTGNERAALKRPPSWSNATSLPSPGCSCCHGQRWWTEASNPRGWRCSTCCPGDHLPAAQRDEVET